MPIAGDATPGLDLYVRQLFFRSEKEMMALRERESGNKN